MIERGCEDGGSQAIYGLEERGGSGDGDESI